MIENNQKDKKVHNLVVNDNISRDEDVLLTYSEKPLWQILYMISGLAVVQFVSSIANQLSIHSLVIVVIIIATPIWFYQCDYQLFSRRAVLSASGSKHGLLIKLFYEGTFIKILLFIKSFIYAIVIISFGALYNDAYWWVLYSDVIIIALFIHYSAKTVSRETR